MPLTLYRWEREREREEKDPFSFATDAEMSSWAQEMGTPVEKEEDEAGAVNCLIFWDEEVTSLFLRESR